VLGRDLEDSNLLAVTGFSREGALFGKNAKERINRRTWVADRIVQAHASSSGVRGVEDALHEINQDTAKGDLISPMRMLRGGQRELKRS